MLIMHELNKLLMLILASTLLVLSLHNGISMASDTIDDSRDDYEQISRTLKSIISDANYNLGVESGEACLLSIVDEGSMTFRYDISKLGIYNRNIKVTSICSVDGEFAEYIHVSNPPSGILRWLIATRVVVTIIGSEGSNLITFEIVDHESLITKLSISREQS